MAYYWDTSAILAFLFKEEATKKLNTLGEKGGLPGYTSFFTWVEMESGITRRLAEKSIDHSDLPLLRFQIQKLEQAFSLIWPDPLLLNQTKKLVQEFALKPGDSLQLASAMILANELNTTIYFICLDNKLCKAAEAVGLKVST